MNNIVKNVIIFSSGLLIGAACGWFFTKSHYQAKSDRMVDEIRTFYRERKTMPEKEDETPEVKDEEPHPVQFSEEDMVEYHKIVKRYGQENPSLEYLMKTMPDYTKRDEDDYDPDAPEDWDEDDDSEEDDIRAEEEREKHPEEDPPPYLISANEYMLGGKGGLYDQDCLTYFAVDGVLVDEYDQVVDREHIGEKNLALLNTQECIYVRNVELGMEWEIIKMNRSFDEYMRGMEEHPIDDDEEYDE